jgi:hypothetical protein
LCPQPGTAILTATTASRKGTVSAKTVGSDKASSSTLFEVGRSIRYHNHRLAHFDRLHRLSSAVTILLAGVIFMELGGAKSPLYIRLLSAAGALLGTFDLILGFAKCADVHRDLKRRFAELEIALMNGLAAGEAEVMQRQIEISEPPIYSALNILCFQEMCVAEGRDNPFHPLEWLPRMTANWYRWPNIAASMQRKSPRQDSATG